MTAPVLCPLCGGEMNAETDLDGAPYLACSDDNVCALTGHPAFIEFVRARIAELQARAEWAEAVNAALLPYQERAVLAEKRIAELQTPELDELRRLLRNAGSIERLREMVEEGR